MRRNFKKETGFTLVELMMVLLIITVTTKIVTVSFVDIGYTARYEQTKERLESIRQAILGNPKQTINGQQAVSGFVADMGRLPDNLRELLQAGNCSDVTKKTPSSCVAPANWSWNSGSYSGKCSNTAFSNKADCHSNGNGWLTTGWNGPYLTVSGSADSPDAFTDGWGNTTTDNNYGWRLDNSSGLGVESWGKDGQDEVDNTCADYDNDCAIHVAANDYLINIDTLSVVIVMPDTKSCSDPSKPDQTSCTAIVGNTWNPTYKTLCLKIFSRKDGDIITTESANHPSVPQNGSSQTIGFELDSDLATAGIQPSPIAKGINSVAVYEHNGTACTNTFYPATRQNPIQVDFHPHTTLPVINW